MRKSSGIDSSVVGRARRGDADALARLIYHVQPTLLAQLSTRIPPEHATMITAEDILQETCLVAQRTVRHFESDCPVRFDTWIRKIAANCLADCLRRLDTKKRGGGFGHVNIESDDHATSFVDPMGSPRRRVEALEAVIAIQANLDELPSIQRRAVKLVHIDQRSLTDAAAVMGKSRGGLRLILNRAIKQLRASMGCSSQWFSKK